MTRQERFPVRVTVDQERITGLTRQQIAALVDPPAGDARP